MAAPVDAGRATTNGSTVTTSQALNLPGSIASGDYLLAYVRAAGTTTISWPAGWTVKETSSADASDDSWSLAERTADGTEGATITVTLGTGQRIAGIVWRITGTGPLGSEAVGAVGSASHPNSPALTTAKAHDTLWMSVAGGEWAKTLVSGPAGYANPTLIASTGGASGTNCTAMGASLQSLADTTEDPGAWALDSATVWNAYTIAVYTMNPDLRVTQLPVEAALLPTSAKVRATQVPVEAAYLPNVATLRMTQVPIEVIYALPLPKLRVTQLPIEVIYWRDVGVGFRSQILM